MNQDNFTPGVGKSPDGSNFREQGHYTVTIPGRFPGLNDMIALAKRGRGKYQPYARDKATNTEMVAWCCKAAHIPPLKRAAIHITWVEPNERRDPDNIGAAQKYVLDGIVAAGVIPDDRQKYVSGITHEWKVDKANPRVIVEIEAVS